MSGLVILYRNTKSKPAINMRKIIYGGWNNCIELSNGEIDLVATTDVGPRIIRLGFAHGKNLFKEEPEQMGKTGGDKWKGYGGHRFWHAPEVAPRTYAPDNAPVEHDWNGTRLKLIQPVEAITGLQKELEITLDPTRNRVTVLHRLINKNLWAIEAAPWALSVMAGPGRAIFPQEPVTNQFLPVRPLALWGYTNMADSRYTWGTKYIQMQCDPGARNPQKIGIMNSLGWAAYASGEELFIKRFEYDPRVQYPDFGCNMECYTNGGMLEVETLGALGKLEPGAFTEHTEHWFLFKAKIGPEEGALDKELLPLLKETDRS